jgi:hypothetical protein
VPKYLRGISFSGSNISRHQWQGTVHRERGKKTSVPSQKVTVRGPHTSILDSWSPKCVERSHQRHIPRLQLCNFRLSFQPSGVSSLLISSNLFSFLQGFLYLNIIPEQHLLHLSISKSYNYHPETLLYQQLVDNTMVLSTTKLVDKSKSLSTIHSLLVTS